MAKIFGTDPQAAWGGRPIPELPQTNTGWEEGVADPEMLRKMRFPGGRGMASWQPSAISFLRVCSSFQAKVDLLSGKTPPNAWPVLPNKECLEWII